MCFYSKAGFRTVVCSVITEYALQLQTHSYIVYIFPPIIKHVQFQCEYTVILLCAVSFKNFVIFKAGFRQFYLTSTW